MTRGVKTGWKAIQVQGPGGGRVLDTGDRLAALYRFQNGEGLAGYRFVQRDGESPIDPADVDWDAFPVLAALEAVTRDELRRLRDLVRDPGGNDDRPGHRSTLSDGAPNPIRPRYGSFTGFSP